MAFRQTAAAAALGTGMFLGISALPAQAAYTVALTQVGTNVLATGRGSIDLTDLTYFETDSTPPEIQPNAALIATGALSSADIYRGISGTTFFGSGLDTVATISSGDIVGVKGSFGILAVPSGYTGGPLSDTAIYSGASLTSLGVTPGSYVWTWGTGEHADTFTLDVPRGSTPVPEPSGLIVLPLSLAGVLVARRYRKM